MLKFFKAAAENPEQCCLVFSDNLKIKFNKNKEYETVKKGNLFWQHCGESDIKFKGKGTEHMDPVLCTETLPSSLIVL